MLATGAWCFANMEGVFGHNFLMSYLNFLQSYSNNVTTSFDENFDGSISAFAVFKTSITFCKLCNSSGVKIE
jgi:hypothetical protein